MNIFEKAAKHKVRFDSDRGQLTVEQLFDLGLVALDGIARAINKELKEVSEGSFINITPDTRGNSLQLKLDILKHVIEDKMAAQAEIEKKLARTAKRKLLLEALENKENEDLKNMSKDDILKQLEELE